MLEELIDPLEAIAESEVILESGGLNSGNLSIVKYGDAEYNLGMEGECGLWITIRRKNNPKYRIKSANFFYEYCIEMTLEATEEKGRLIHVRIWRNGDSFRRFVDERDKRADVPEGIKHTVPISIYRNSIGAQSVSLGGFFTSECTLCTEIEREELVVEGTSYGNRDIYRTRNFRVKPTLGQLLEGHVIIVTEEHYLNIGGIPAVMHEELNHVIEKVVDELKITYDSPSLLFEHGPTIRNRSGSCIDHAHLHAIPMHGCLKDWIPDDARELFGFGDLSDLYKKNIPYLFFQENDGRRYVIEVAHNLQSQYIRRIIARQNCLPQEDWRSDFNIPSIFSTYEKMKKARGPS